MKLNLGCGRNYQGGWINVDLYPAVRPDVVHDLENFPWPFEDQCAEEILLQHVLEHLGKDNATFLKIMQELYRVCAPGGTIRIIAPHPRHDDFLQDPTHVRAIVPEQFRHFSVDVNEDWIRENHANTPMAVQLRINFEVVSSEWALDPAWEEAFRSGAVSREVLEAAMRDRNNVIRSAEIVLKAVKPYRRNPKPGNQGGTR